MSRINANAFYSGVGGELLAESLGTLVLILFALEGYADGRDLFRSVTRRSA